MVDATFQKEIDRNLDRIGDHTDRIIDANDLSPNPVRIAKEAEKIISLAKRIMRLATINVPSMPTASRNLTSLRCKGKVVK